MTANLITLLDSLNPPDSDRCPWPITGHAYAILMDVERVDYPDIHPLYALIHGPAEIAEILSQHDLMDLVGEGCLPIASGLFSCTLTYWHESCCDWETGSVADDYGFEVSNLRKLPDHP